MPEPPPPLCTRMSVKHLIVQCESLLYKKYSHIRVEKPHESKPLRFSEYFDCEKSQSLPEKIYINRSFDYHNNKC